MAVHLPPIPYQAINRHAVIGDRRTAALLAADGTLDWLCVPDYDGAVVFGALLDAQKGGYWRFGPAALRLGDQRYHCACHGARHDLAARRRPTGADRVHAGARRRPAGAAQGAARHRAAAARDRRPCPLLSATGAGVQLRAWSAGSGIADARRIHAGAHLLLLWTSRPILQSGDTLDATFDLKAGEECWAVLAWGDADLRWSVDGGAASSPRRRSTGRSGATGSPARTCAGCTCRAG